MYESLEDLPAHLFLDRSMKKPASKEFHAYLKWMLDNHPDDLDYIWSESQKYVEHGGAWKESFSNWKKKLRTSLNTLEGTYD